jgi:asparagine N-glycosylation enzyme membrane subunit Stt3
MVIADDFEISYLVVAFALLGAILIGSLLDTLHLQKLHPRLVGATLGALLGFALVEAVPLFT